MILEAELIGKDKKAIRTGMIGFHYTYTKKLNCFIITKDYPTRDYDGDLWEVCAEHHYYMINNGIKRHYCNMEVLTNYAYFENKYRIIFR